MEEKVTIELDGQNFEIDIAKLIGAISELDTAWQSVANRRMKRGKYEGVLQVLYLCQTGHKISNDEVTPDMMATVAKELV